MSSIARKIQKHISEVRRRSGNLCTKHPRQGRRIKGIVTFRCWPCSDANEVKGKQIIEFSY